MRLCCSEGGIVGIERARGRTSKRAGPGRWAPSQPCRLCVASDEGRYRPLISAKGNHRPGLVSVCHNAGVAALRYPTATELRAYVIQSTDALDRRRFITDELAGWPSATNSRAGARSTVSRMDEPNPVCAVAVAGILSGLAWRSGV